MEDRKAVVNQPQGQNLYISSVEEVYSQLPRYETIKKFAFIPSEFSKESGEPTPTLKVKRWVVQEEYKDIINRMYAE